MSRDDASRLVNGLRTRFAPPEYAVFEQVRSATGSATGLRIADALAVALWPSRGFEIVGFELKVDRGDWIDELKVPAKSAAIRRFCSRWFLVVPAPRKKVIFDLDELPEGWGCIEVGAGGVEERRSAVERDAEQPPWSFVQALLRSASEAAAKQAAGGGAPEWPIVGFDGEHMQLACKHWVPRIRLKKMPPRVACFQCADEQTAGQQARTGS